MIAPRLATAWSSVSTIGMISSAIVDVADASKVLDSALVCYAESAKTGYLNVPPECIERYGVVSEEVAALMARGAAKAAGSDCAISTTGVAGPTGGSESTPVGTVCFGFFLNGKLATKTMRFDGGRNEVRRQATEFALEEMYKML